MKANWLHFLIFFALNLLLPTTSHAKQKFETPTLQFCEGDSTVLVRLEWISDSLYVLHADTYWKNKKIQSSNHRLPYSVYQFQIGDVDNNGEMDIAVGVIKKTYYDSIARKRPFFFKLYKGNIRPLWLGSRLSQPLENFFIKKSGQCSVIQSIEIEKNGRYLVAQYVWAGFGFRFEHYIARNLSQNDAYHLVNEQLN